MPTNAAMMLDVLPYISLRPEPSSSCGWHEGLWLPSDGWMLPVVPRKQYGVTSVSLPVSGAHNMGDAASEIHDMQHAEKFMAPSEYYEQAYCMH